MPKPKGYWKKWENVEHELRKVVEELGHFPTHSELRELGKSGLSIAISEYYSMPEVQQRFGYAPSRKPKDYWTLEEILCECKNIIQERGNLPPQKQLPSRLLNAIWRHGGLVHIRELLGIEQLLKPPGYWEDLSNVEQELKKFIDQIGHFPTHKEFRERGESSLAYAIVTYHGGINTVRKKMKFPILKKSTRHYADWDNIASDLKKLWTKHSELGGRLPSAQWLRTHGYDALCSGICSYHGFRKAREKLGQAQVLKNPHGYYKDEKNLLDALHTIWREHPALKGRLPAQSWFPKNGYSTVGNAIAQYHGGFRNFRTKLGQRQLRKYAHGELKDWRNFTQAIETLFQEHTELQRQLPSCTWLADHGYPTIYTAARVYHGGIHHVRNRLGQDLLRKKMGYWKDFANIRKELEQIILVREELQGTFPSTHWLSHQGYSALVSAITKHHGGIKEVKRKLGYPTNDQTKEQLEHILQEYLEQ